MPCMLEICARFKILHGISIRAFFSRTSYSQSWFAVDMGHLWSCHFGDLSDGTNNWSSGEHIPLARVASCLQQSAFAGSIYCVA